MLRRIRVGNKCDRSHKSWKLDRASRGGNVGTRGTRTATAVLSTKRVDTVDSRRPEFSLFFFFADDTGRESRGKRGGRTHIQRMRARVYRARAGDERADFSRVK